MSILLRAYPDKPEEAAGGLEIIKMLCCRFVQRFWLRLLTSLWHTNNPSLTLGPTRLSVCTMALNNLKSFFSIMWNAHNKSVIWATRMSFERMSFNKCHFSECPFNKCHFKECHQNECLFVIQKFQKSSENIFFKNLIQIVSDIILFCFRHNTLFIKLFILPSGPKALRRGVVSFLLDPEKIQMFTTRGTKYTLVEK